MEEGLPETSSTPSSAARYLNSSSRALEERGNREASFEEQHVTSSGHFPRRERAQGSRRALWVSATLHWRVEGGCLDSLCLSVWGAAEV